LLILDYVQKAKANTSISKIQYSGRACLAHWPAEQQPPRRNAFPSCWGHASKGQVKLARRLLAQTEWHMKESQRKWKKSNYSCFYEQNFPEHINRKWISWQSANGSLCLLLSMPQAEFKHSHCSPKSLISPDITLREHTKSHFILQGRDNSIKTLSAAITLQILLANQGSSTFSLWDSDGL